MIKDLKSLSLLDILPDSILSDEQMKASAEALDTELQKVTAETIETLHMPRLDELPEAVIDLLAWQWHVDYYEPVGMSIETKRRLVKESVAWHRMKGTPAAVESVVSAAFDTSTVKEWYEYGGKPFYFKVVTEDVTTDKTTLDRMRKAIDTVKNVRSWLEKIEFLLHLSDKEDALDKTLLDCASRDNGRYPWRGRYFDGSWNFTPPMTLDGSRPLNGSWTLNAVAEGEEDQAREPNLFMGRELDGSWNFGMSSDSRKVFFNSAETDFLSIITPKLMESEKYGTYLDFSGAGRYFDGSWRLGVQPIDDGNMHIENRIGFADKERVKEISIIETYAPDKETYPMVRLWSFNGAWTFKAPASFDGENLLNGSYSFNGVMSELDPACNPNNMDGHAAFGGAWTFRAPQKTLTFNADESKAERTLIDTSFVPAKENCQPKETEKESIAILPYDRQAKTVYDGAKEFNGWKHDSGYVEQTNEETIMGASESLCHAEWFDGEYRFDGAISHGGEKGPEEKEKITITEGRWFNGIWNFDGDTSIWMDGKYRFDGSVFCCLLRDTGKRYDGTMRFNGAYRYKPAARTFDQYSYTA